MTKRILACLGVVLFMAIGGAMAQTDTDTLTVTATVVDAALITAVGDISFGNYDPTDSTPTDADGSVTIRATTGMGYTVYIGSDRSMTDGTDTLNYELYSDAARSSVWGSTLATGEPYTSTSNAETTYSIYGRIAALQDVQAGGYSDTVTITVEW
jgi:spore coat protein U-like protein